MYKKPKQVPKKSFVRTGDTVLVCTGNDRGKKGKILRVIPKTYRAVVQGVNKVHRHMKPSAKNPKGEIIRREAPLHISNLMLINPETDKPTRVGRKLDEKGKLMRYDKKTGNIIQNG